MNFGFLRKRKEVEIRKETCSSCQQEFISDVVNDFLSDWNDSRTGVMTFKTCNKCLKEQIETGIYNKIMFDRARRELG